MATVTVKSEYSEDEEDNNVDMDETSVVDEQENEISKPMNLSKPKLEKCAIMVFDDLPYSMREDNEKTLFKCKECTWEKSHLSILMKHINETHPKMSVPPQGSAVYKCDRVECEKMFYKHGELTKHLIDKHIDTRKEKKAKCILCNMAFEYNYQLKKHTLTIHMDKSPYQCDICNQHFVSKAHLTKHLRIHKEKKEFVCSECEATFPNNYALICHVAKKHNAEKPFKCHLCTNKYSFDYHLDIHLKTHDPKKGFLCGMCDRLFTNRFSLQQHTKYRHLKVKGQKDKSNQINTTKGVKPCKANNIPSEKNCTITVKSESVDEMDALELNEMKDTKEINNVEDLKANDSMKDKVVEENGGLNNVCETNRRDSCDSDDIPLSILAKGLEKEEVIEIEPLIFPETLLGNDFDGSSDSICQTCNAQFSKQIFLEKHIQTVHTNIYQCKQCEKKFCTRKTLVHHLRTHKSLFKCHFCPKVFEYEFTLKTHIDSHKNMSIKCHICYQNCEDEKLYRKHMLAHSSDGKLFCCKVCPKIFLEMNILKRHYSRVHRMSKALQTLKGDTMYA